jgi:hypothetical protein
MFKEKYVDMGVDMEMNMDMEPDMDMDMDIGMVTNMATDTGTDIDIDTWHRVLDIFRSRHFFKDLDVGFQIPEKVLICLLT